MAIPLIGIEEVMGALHNARVVMNAYLRSRINLTADGEIRIAVNKSQKFMYETEDGKFCRIATVLLKCENDTDIVMYNGHYGTATHLQDVPANELYTLCSLVESFWKHIKTEDKTDNEDVECEIVK